MNREDIDAKSHPAAKLFPMMSESELKDLAKDIEKNELIEPISTHNGLILDRRKRMAACEMLGIAPVTVQVTTNSPVRFVATKNLHRRHLTPSQRAAIAAEMLPLLAEESRKRQVAALETLERGEVMTARREESRDPFGVFTGPTYEVPAFSTEETAEIVGVLTWRLKKFLDVKSYPLEPSANIGGRRRMFSTADVCRIATAVRLLSDGFNPKIVVKALEYIEDEDLLGVIDEAGEPARGGIYFMRGEKGPEIHFFAPGKAPKITVDGPEYYVLDLDQLLGEIDLRIRAVLEKRGRGRERSDFRK